MFRCQTKQRVVYLQEGVSFGCSTINVSWRISKGVFLFIRYNGRKSIIGYYGPMFRNLLGRGQKMQPELFATGFFIGYLSLRISPWSGGITEAENNNMDTAAIKIINRWRKREESIGTEAGLSMRQEYTQVSRSIVASLHFSHIH